VHEEQGREVVVPGRQLDDRRRVGRPFGALGRRDEARQRRLGQEVLELHVTPQQHPQLADQRHRLPRGAAEVGEAAFGVGFGAERLPPQLVHDYRDLVPVARGRPRC
jgi:hypothetical protein